MEIKNNKWHLEIIRNETKRGSFKSALFDFDGTLSLIREGWRDVMVPYFVEILKQTPEAEDENTLTSLVKDFVDLHTGKQTIYQCICLNEEVVKRCGEFKDPLEYKKEYHRRLINKIEHRLSGLREGKIEKNDMMVPGSVDFLKILHESGIILYLASGTDEGYVLEEAELLGVTQFFNGGIYGAIDEYKLFSKSMIIKKIIETNRLDGHELIGFGDGYVEIKNVKEAEGFSVGLATNEKEREGIDKWKRERLIKAGADIIIADFREAESLNNYLFKKEV